MLAIISFLALIVEIVAYQDEFSDNIRDGYNRRDPDGTFHGFFPFWGIVCLILSAFFLVIAGLAFVCHLIGCRTPVESGQPSTESKTPFSQMRNSHMST